MLHNENGQSVFYKHINIYTTFCLLLIFVLDYIMYLWDNVALIYRQFVCW